MSEKERLDALEKSLAELRATIEAMKQQCRDEKAKARRELFGMEGRAAS